MGSAVPTSSIDLGAGTTAACNELAITFKPETPTVLFLVDRSSSMFDSKYWEPLKAAVLEVIKGLEHEVRFGFVAYTGVNGGTCPMLNSVASITLGNAAAIEAAYNASSVDPRVESGGMKTETPTMWAIDATVPKLLAVTEPGSKYLVLVTDGEPDFCDDGREPCAKDLSVAAVQNAFTAGIGTFVLGLGGVNPAPLQDLANAGAGQPVTMPTQDLSYCGSNPLKGTYAPTGGAAEVFSPAVTTNALADQLRTVIAGVKSCTFQLDATLKIVPEQAGMGQVLLDGMPLTYQSPDGWQMKGNGAVELVGAACKQLQAPTTKGIVFNFPCGTVILR